MKILILEDNPERIKKFKSKLIGHVVVCCDNVPNCISYLESDTFDVLLLDHDLDGKVYQIPSDTTGYGVVKWLISHPNNIPSKIYIHSLNDTASNLMLQTLANYNILAEYVPFLLG